MDKAGVAPTIPFIDFNTSVVPKGILVAVGGNEDKEQDLDVLKRIIALSKKTAIAAEVITTASEIPEEVGRMYRKAFKSIGADIRIMHIRERKQADKTEYIQRIREAELIFFTGGNQLRITSILGGSELLNTIVYKYYNEYCIVAGTSAGATAMSQTMIYGGESSEALLKGTVQLTNGVGLVQNIVIDSHFIKRGRFSRLMEVVVSNPGHIGVGLGEDTGVIIRKGYLMETIGNGLVVIFDGRHIRQSNLSSIGTGGAIALENMCVHTLVSGYGYDLLKKTFLSPLEVSKLVG